MKFNPFFCKTEGWRRLTIALSVLGFIGWTWFVAVETNGFSKDLQDPGEALVVVVGFPIVFYLLLLGLRGIILWVIRGFQSRQAA